MTNLRQFRPVKRQATIGAAVMCSGIGLHNGEDVSLHLRPAPIGSGLFFVRTDIKDRDNIIPVRPDNVHDIRRCTTIGNAAGVTVSTIEHLMAALSASGIDNLRMEISGPELPAMDGSAEPYLKLFERARIVSQDAPRRYIKVLKTVECELGGAFGRIEPASALQLDVTIDFPEKAIGTQRIEIAPDVKSFRERIGSARTFARAHEVAALQAAGLSLGGSFDNAIVVDGEDVLNPGGLRYADEFVRHKALDLMGDLYVGGPIIGRVTTQRAGHALNHALMLAFFADPAAWAFAHIHAEPPANEPASVLEELAAAQ